MMYQKTDKWIVDSWVKDSTKGEIKTNFKTKRVKKPSKVREWAAARAKLKVLFAERGVTRCESCGGLFGFLPMALSFAHSKPRRYIVGAEIYQVVLVCIPCHTEIDLYRADQFANVMEIIDRRGWDAAEILGEQ